MARIAQLERELEEARKELWKEDVDSYRILMREMTDIDSLKLPVSDSNAYE